MAWPLLTTAAVYSWTGRASRGNIRMDVSIKPVLAYFMGLQDDLCSALEDMDGSAAFSREELPGASGGIARPRVLADGQNIEKAAVQFTHSLGSALPSAATERNPHLAGQAFQAAAVSVIVHPRNPYVPTTHMNLRFFLVDGRAADTARRVNAPNQPTWYFGGGFDLTPYYAFDEDCAHWHATARAAVGCHYEAFKAACDDYFRLPHRNEQRGIGGLFFDDWSEGGFARSIELAKAVGNAFLPAYRPIFQRRASLPHGDRERCWQLYRRGRYAEFNLAIDRGTRYGLQSGRRVESVLASLPPLAAWQYNREPEAGSPEAELASYIKGPREWVAD